MKIQSRENIQSREKIQPKMMGENLLREKDQTIYNESAGRVLSSLGSRVHNQADDHMCKQTISLGGYCS